MWYLKIDPVTFTATGGGINMEPESVSSYDGVWIPFTGEEGDGWVWSEETLSWSPPAPILVSLSDIRLIRDNLLGDSDWRVSVSDYPNEDKDQWVAYRQLLRDFPDTYVPVESPSWPTQPNQ